MASDSYMTRKEAFEILGLKPGSDRFAVERRYTLLAKRYSGMADDETLKKVEQITTAYDVLTGRYVPPTPPDPKMEKVVFGKKKKDWANIWDYGKVKLLVGTLIAIFVVWMIYSIATNTPPDFTVSSFGDFYQLQGAVNDQPTKLEKLIREENPEIQDPSFGYNLITEREGVDYQLVMAAQIKLTLMTTGAEKIDILIMDQERCDMLLNNGVLVPLDRLYERLEKDKPELFKGMVKPLKTRLSADVLPDGEKPEEHIYGFDLSEKQLLNSLDLGGAQQIIGICYHSERKELAEEVIYKLLMSADDWYNPDLPLFKAAEPERREQMPAESSKASAAP